MVQLTSFLVTLIGCVFSSFVSLFYVARSHSLSLSLWVCFSHSQKHIYCWAIVTIGCYISCWYVSSLWKKIPSFDRKIFLSTLLFWLQLSFLRIKATWNLNLFKLPLFEVRDWLSDRVLKISFCRISERHHSSGFSSKYHHAAAEAAAAATSCLTSAEELKPISSKQRRWQRSVLIKFFFTPLCEKSNVAHWADWSTVSWNKPLLTSGLTYLNTNQYRRGVG